MGEGVCILSVLDSERGWEREATDFFQSFKMETINSHKLPENIGSVSKRIRNFKIAAQAAQQAT